MIDEEGLPQAKGTTRKRRIAFLMLACLSTVILLLAVAVHRGKEHLKSAPNWRPRPVPVVTDSVSRISLRQTLSYLARLESVAVTEISPELNARVMELYADDGDKVEVGALLAKLDDRDLRLQVDNLKAKMEAQRARIQANRAALESAQSTVSFLKRETARDQELFDQKGISASALDGTIDQLDSAIGKARALEEESQTLTRELEGLSAQLEEARVRLSYTEVRSPVRGRIGRRYVEVGDMVGPATPLFSFLDLSAYRLAFGLVQEDLQRVRPGQKVLIQWPIEPAGDNRDGVLARIFPSLEAGKTVRAEVDLSCRCPEALKIGTFVPIQVVLREETGLTVPRRAIVPLPERRQGVYVVRSNELVLVQVETDFFNEKRALVRGDLQEGEPVVVGEYLQWIRHHQGQPVEVQQ